MRNNCKEPFGIHTKPPRAIHCGDLTDESKLEEFKTTFQLLKGIDTPLKLVIAGNHDFTLDTPAFKSLVAEMPGREDPELVMKTNGKHGQVNKLLEEAKWSSIIFLEEGTHHFTLENGASLTVYASPYTPSKGNWGFVYNPEQGHDFQIEGVDLVMTHGPPEGVMDRTIEGKRAGCPNLFAAIARARPHMHCFGHIHEGWGAKLVTWRENISERPSHFSDIDNSASQVIAKLSRSTGAPEALDETRGTREGCYSTGHCEGDETPINQGAQTLFVNAAIKGSEENTMQPPWLIDIELPKASQMASPSSKPKPVSNLSSVYTTLNERLSRTDTHHLAKKHRRQFSY